MTLHRSRPEPETLARIRVSFEFFPPKDAAGEARWWEAVRRLAPLSPSFVSVTYGAGGSTRERTLAMLRRLASDTTLDPAAHITCVGASRAEVDAVIACAMALGVKRFVALRGDPPDGAGGRYRLHPEGYGSSADLVAALVRAGATDVCVSAYPEKHPDSADVAADIEILKRKVDQGATRAITQFFFENDRFERYVERVRRAGIFIPIVPGILPIHDFRQAERFAARCGAFVPEWLRRKFDGLENDPATHRLVACAVAAEQVLDLLDRGVADFHFYTLNRADLVFALCHMLGRRSAEPSSTSMEAAA